MDWDLFWAWTGDDDVWSWLRTASAALFGAIVGGAFTLFGQARQAKSQRDLQTDTLAEEARLDGERWNRELVDSLRRESLGGAHQLFERFTAVNRAIQSEKPSFSDLASSASWLPTWREIWTKDIGLDLDVGSRLLTDEVALGQVQRIVGLLDRASYVTKDSENPGCLNLSLREAADHLTAEAIEVMGAYLRRVSHDSKREPLMAALENAYVVYSEWEDREIARQMVDPESDGSSKTVAQDGTPAGDGQPIESIRGHGTSAIARTSNEESGETLN